MKPCFSFFLGYVVVIGLSIAHYFHPEFISDGTIIAFAILWIGVDIVDSLESKK